jgi:hypothetical protein
MEHLFLRIEMGEVCRSIMIFAAPWLLWFVSLPLRGSRDAGEVPVEEGTAEGLRVEVGDKKAER